MLHILLMSDDCFIREYLVSVIAMNLLIIILMCASYCIQSCINDIMETKPFDVAMYMYI